MRKKYVHITQPTDDELDAQRVEVDLDPRKMRGCGKRSPGILYQREPAHFQELTTSDTERCGDLFPSPESQPLSILLCRACAIKYGLTW